MKTKIETKPKPSKEIAEAYLQSKLRGDMEYYVIREILIDMLDEARVSAIQDFCKELEAKPKDDKQGTLLPIISPVIGWREMERYKTIKAMHLNPQALLTISVDDLCECGHIRARHIRRKCYVASCKCEGFFLKQE